MDAEVIYGEPPGTPASRGSSRRRMWGVRRDNRISVRLSDQEFADIQQAAAKAGKTPAAWLAGVGVRASDGSTPVAPQIDPEFKYALIGTRQYLSAVGNNLNQIARKVNSGGEVPAELPAIVERVKATVRKLDQVSIHLAGVKVQ